MVFTSDGTVSVRRVSSGRCSRTCRACLSTLSTTARASLATATAAASGLGFAVRRLSAEFRQPARLDDALTVRTALKGFGGSSIALEQAIWRNATLLVEILLELVCINGLFRPVRIPAALKTAIETHLVPAP